MQSRHDCDEQEKYYLCLTLEDVKHKLQIEKSWQLVDGDIINDFTICIVYCNNQVIEEGN